MSKATPTSTDYAIMQALNSAAIEKSKRIKEQEQIVNEAMAALEVLKAEKAGLEARYLELRHQFWD